MHYPSQPSDLIQYSVNSPSGEAPRYAVFSSLQFFTSLTLKYSPQHHDSDFVNMRRSRCFLTIHTPCLVSAMCSSVRPGLQIPNLNCGEFHTKVHSDKRSQGQYFKIKELRDESNQKTTYTLKLLLLTETWRPRLSLLPQMVKNEGKQNGKRGWVEKKQWERWRISKAEFQTTTYWQRKPQGLYVGLRVRKFSTWVGLETMELHSREPYLI